MIDGRNSRGHCSGTTYHPAMPGGIRREAGTGGQVRQHERERGKGREREREGRREKERDRDRETETETERGGWGDGEAGNTRQHFNAILEVRPHCKSRYKAPLVASITLLLS